MTLNQASGGAAAPPVPKGPGARQGLAALLLALGLLLPGLLYLVLLVLLLAQPDEGLLLGAVVMGALALFVLVLGGLLAGPGQPYRLPPRRTLALFVLALLLGSLLLASGLPLLIAVGLPPLHLAGALLPALLALALARGGPARRDLPVLAPAPSADAAASADPGDGASAAPLAAEVDETAPDAPWDVAALPAAPSQAPTPFIDRPPLTWSTAGAGLAWGGCAATFLALIVESLLGLLILVGLLATWPPAQELLGEANRALQSGAQPDPEAQAALLRQLAGETPLLLAAWLLMGLLAPFTEELTKLLGPLWSQEGRVPAAPAAARAGRQQAWWRGVAAGAGFGAFEAIFYSAMALQPAAWALAVALRACTTLMHGVFTGMAALGWHLLRAERRRGLGVLGLLGAFLGHALWNSLALGAVMAGLQAGGTTDGPPTGPLAGTLALGVVATFYGLLAFFTISSRRLARPL